MSLGTEPHQQVLIANEIPEQIFPLQLHRHQSAVLRACMTEKTGINRSRRSVC